jgi:sugar (pentulose or hexulose) kinase
MTVFCTDWHNSLKLGFDVETLCYPAWFCSLLSKIDISKDCLPRVVEPGMPAGTLSTHASSSLGLPADCVVVGGTTDSIAAFLASEASSPGQAVSSLGSTLAMKMLSTVPVQDSARGIYSHRLGNQWLVGGASNVGCAVLRQEGFSNQELAELSKKIDPQQDTPLKYYPLPKTGERFPINDANKQPLLDPKPLTPQGNVDRAAYLHGILQAIAVVEKEVRDDVKK